MESLNNVDVFFHDVYTHLENYGDRKTDRTGVGTLSSMGITGRFSLLNRAMPLLSTRPLKPRSFMHETLMFISGSSSIRYLRDNKVGIWNQWFIPGTDVYDDPCEPFTFREHCTAAMKAGKSTAMWDFVRQLPPVTDERAFAEIPFTRAEGPVYVGVTKSHADAIQTFLHEVCGISRYKRAGGKQVSLQTRLARVSKNDVEKWAKINECINEDWSLLNESTTGAAILAAGDDVPLTIFVDDAFKKIKVRPVTAQAIVTVLDSLGVPAYPLKDADIGAGSYGVQWRRHQDTQIIKPHQLPEFVKQGYVSRGEFNDIVEKGKVKLVVYREVDQLQNAIDQLKNNPDDRRMIVCAWNPGRVWQAALPPCHLYFQFRTALKHVDVIVDKYSERPGDFDLMLAAMQMNFRLDLLASDEEIVEYFTSKYEAQDKEFLAWLQEYGQREDVGINIRYLSCFVLLRSNDMVLGAPSNVGQYAMLTHMVGHLVGMDPYELVTVSVDAHIYLNHREGLEELLTRGSTPRCNPRLNILRKVESIDDFRFEDFEITDYDVEHEHIEFEVAI